MLTTRRSKSLWVAFFLLIGLVAVLTVSTNAIGRPIYAVSTNSIGIICTEEADNIFDLQTSTGYAFMPDGNTIFMWSYVDPTYPYGFQTPGPVLCITEGDTITVNLTNNLSEPTSIIFPGQTNVTATGGSAGIFTQEAAASGGTVSYTFTASHPGTYLYESGTEQEKQIQMGLYGAIIVRPALGPNYAYNDVSTEFATDKEYLLLMHEIDPVIHQAVERGDPFSVMDRHDRYWTINGRSMPDTLNDNNSPFLPFQPYGALVLVEADSALPALVRYANAGTVNHPFHPHGDHLTVIGQDGRPLGNAAIEAFTRTMAAGQTAELLFTWDNVDNWQPTGTGDPLPVTLPGLNDLVFKDGVTFYSGDPDLSETGTLPPGVTTFNECGEFYFPWHSHALNEVQNFDEGFGGLMTLVRVEPPGGCP